MAWKMKRSVNFDSMFEFSWISVAAWSMVAIMIAIILKVMSVNILPYIDLLGGRAPLESKLPIIGWLWDAVQLLYMATGAFLAWFLVQASQVCWILISIDRKAHRAAIREYNAEAVTTVVSNQADRATRQLAKKTKRLPFAFIEWSAYIALAGYVVEFIVNWRRYPIVANWTQFFAGLQVGSFSAVNFENLMSFLWGTLSFEVFVVVLLVCIQWAMMSEKGDNPV